MLQRLKALRQQYPRQFWLLFIGLLISTSGGSMIWPFLMIYVSERLKLPLATAASLMTVNSAMGLVFAFVGGPLADRAGRKGVMVVGLAVQGLTYLLLSRASSLPAFAVLMGMSGAVTPLYRIGADAMLADLVPPPRRPEAYSLLRMSNNVGVALGPALGGVIAATSYTYAFYIAAAGMMTYSLLLVLFAVETIPQRLPAARPRESFGGYGRVLRDRQFLAFNGAFTLTTIAAAMMFVLLGVYVKRNFGIPENRYGLIPMTNALMVVFFQYAVTLVVRRYPSLPVLASGALFYAVGVGSVALGHSFASFWLSMVVMTIGELIMTPTATTLVANLAPPDMRGRYMSIYGLAWGVAIGIGPVVGGFLSDNLGPPAIWYGAAVSGLASAVLFLILANRWNADERRETQNKLNPQPARSPASNSSLDEP